MTTQAATINEAQAIQYALSLFNGMDPTFCLVHPTPDCEAFDVKLHVPGEGYGFLTVTTWLENGRPYGEW
jgi:hypothetical protein